MPFNLPNRNLYSKPDLQALRQALSLSGAYYKVVRQVTNHFNEKGRPDSKQQIEFIEMAIIPTGNYNVDMKEQGGWTAESFEATYIYPDYLQVEDIIEHPNYGKLKVISVEDKREYGASKANTVRLDSVRKTNNNGEWL